jgi:hypothetical protein
MRIQLVVFILGANFSAGAYGRTIKNAALNFTLEVPDRLQAVNGPGGDTIEAFATSDPAQGPPDLTATVFRLHGTIGREHLDPSKAGRMPPGVKCVGVRQQKWKSFNIDVLEMEVTQGDIHMVVRGAQVPLRNEAIQLNIGAPIGKEAEADALLTELLAGLDGPTNWLTDDQRWERLGRATPFALILLIGIVYVIWARLKRRRSSA